MENNNAPLLEMRNIKKDFFGNQVLTDINLTLQAGEVLGLVGENGAGKSTLMKILFGMDVIRETGGYEGEVLIDGQEVKFSDPFDALAAGIGMVHQEFSLIPGFTAAENILLNREPTKKSIVAEAFGPRLNTLDYKEIQERSAKAIDKMGVKISGDMVISDMPVGHKQFTEIARELSKENLKLLILDEPTAVLTPQETRELFQELKILRDSGYTIIFISHKLNEVRELCDRITIIRRGRTMGVYPVREVSEEEISRLMVGRDVVLHLEKKPAQQGDPAIQVENLTMMNTQGQKKLDGISFCAKRGEVFGVAGVEGNGQTELVEALSRNMEFRSGSIRILGQDTSRMSIRQLRALKVSHIPEDRMTTGIAGALSITENAMADKSCDPEFCGRGTLLKKKNIKEYGRRIVERYRVFCKSPDEAVSSLSGGNIQKVVLARELSSDPEVVIADQPTRGVDVGATEFIRKELLNLRDAGKCVFLVSSDLNELLGLADRLIVLCGGRISAYFADTSSITEEDVGRYMLGVDRQSEEEIAEVTK